jgi:hypothetical protein
MDANTLTAVGIVVAAVPTWILVYKGLRQTGESIAKADVLIAGNEKIHKLVNSGSDNMKAEIASLKEELSRAREQTTHLTETINGLVARLLRTPTRPLQMSAGAPRERRKTR